ncbi:hypothetical protein [Prevotella sp.]|uniref:hypothetical protein n=1 Tax=Prevotella sp. TaxID=59823 RepID=UPI003080516C
MRLFEYFKNLVCREKPTPINSEDGFVYKQLRQITSALSQKLVSMQNIEYNISESFVLSSDDWFARAVALEIRKNTHNECYGYLLLHLLHPHCMCDASTNVLYGEKDSLLKFLNSNEGIENLIHGARTLDEKLKNWDDQ